MATEAQLLNDIEDADILKKRFKKYVKTTTSLIIMFVGAIITGATLIDLSTGAAILWIGIVGTIVSTIAFIIIMCFFCENEHPADTLRTARRRHAAFLAEEPLPDKREKRRTGGYY